MGSQKAWKGLEHLGTCWNILAHLGTFWNILEQVSLKAKAQKCVNLAFQPIRMALPTIREKVGHTHKVIRTKGNEKWVRLLLHFLHAFPILSFVLLIPLLKLL